MWGFAGLPTAPRRRELRRLLFARSAADTPSIVVGFAVSTGTPHPNRDAS
nr:hypothetical protein JVH1_4853 [Rhodococcus sp. JVH1]